MTIGTISHVYNDLTTFPRAYLALLKQHNYKKCKTFDTFVCDMFLYESYINI